MAEAANECNRIATQKSDNGKYAILTQKLSNKIHLMHQCCAGVCWNAVIDFTGTIRGQTSPTTMRVKYPIVPCVGLNCNMAGDYDTPTCKPIHQATRLQWGSGINTFGQYGQYGQPKNTNGNIGVFFGEQAEPENDVEESPSRIFVRTASWFCSWWICTWYCSDSGPGECGWQEDSDAALEVPMPPHDCMFDDEDTDENGRYRVMDQNGTMRAPVMSELVYGTTWYFVLPTSACTMWTVMWYQTGDPLEPWIRHNSPIFTLPTLGDARFFMNYPATEYGEAWLKANNPTLTVDGNVFKYDAEMIAYIGQNPHWQSSWHTGDPLVGVPKKKLLLQAGDMEVLCRTEYNPTTIHTAKIVRWEKCHPEHQCIEMPIPEYDYVPRSHPFWEPPLLQPRFLDTGGRMAPFMLRDDPQVQAMYKPSVCLHLDSITGKCNKYGGDAACDTCADQLGTPIDVDD